MTSPPAPQEYAGQRLGLPEDGPGSVAGWGARILALFVDWVASSLVAGGIDSVATWSTDTDRLMPMLVFFVEVTLFTALAGGSFGQLLVRLRVAGLGRPRLGLGRAALRTLLICLVIPPLVFNRDNRGLHDLAVGSITLAAGRATG